MKIVNGYSVLFFIMLLGFTSCFASEKNTLDSIYSARFIKQEFVSGLYVGGFNENEEIRNDEYFNSEELLKLNIDYFAAFRSWRYTSNIQEKYSLLFSAGPEVANGDYESTFPGENYSASGWAKGAFIKTEANYSNRFYYDTKTFTLVSVSGKAKYGWLNKNLEGDFTNENGQVVNEEKKIKDIRLRTFISAKAAWGYGKLSPINSKVIAEKLVQKYYQGRMFSPNEIAAIANKIGEIKNNRRINDGQNSINESEIVSEFLNSKLFLESPEDLNKDWQFGEFEPRFVGRRVEIGPFFNYYNREPDFVYGGFIDFYCHKYYNQSWTRIVNANLSYNKYKQSDWFSFTVDFSWDYYNNLRSKLSMGIKYQPTLVVNDFEEIEPMAHSVTPYLNYFKQLSSKNRMSFKFLYRISSNKHHFIPGPELVLAFYKSSY